MIKRVAHDRRRSLQARKRVITRRIKQPVRLAPARFLLASTPAHEAVGLFIAEEQKLNAAVRAGQEAAEHGDFVPASEVWASVVEAELYT